MMSRRGTAVLLSVLGVAMFLAAVVIWWLPRTSSTALMTDQPRASLGGDSPEGRLIHWQPLERLSDGDSPALERWLLLGRNPDFVLHRAELPQGQDFASLTWQAFPDRGRLDMLVAIVDGDQAAVQRQAQVDWQREGAESGQAYLMSVRVHTADGMQETTESLHVSWHGGAWQLAGQAPTTLQQAATDAARTLAGLNQAFATAGTAVADHTLPIAGTLQRLWPLGVAAAPGGAQGQAWLLLAPTVNEDGLPQAWQGDVYPHDGDHWADWRVWLKADGTWQGAAFATVIPGYQGGAAREVRRVQLRFP